jgi:hypothetical protein
MANLESHSMLFEKSLLDRLSALLRFPLTRGPRLPAMLLKCMYGKLSIGRAAEARDSSK